MTTATEPATAPATHEPETLTYSRMQKHKTCNMAHFLAYEMLIRPIRTSEPLTKGKAFHEALETYDQTPGEHNTKKEAGIQSIAAAFANPPLWCNTPDDIHTWNCNAAAVITMFSMHADYYQNDNLEVLATEQSYNLPIINPATGAEARNFRSAGKIDRIVKLDDGRIAVQEYKTTRSEIAPDADYWKRPCIDSQISGYVLAGRGLGHPVETVLYDVTRWPAIRPYKATPQEQRKYTKSGTLYANQHEHPESPEAFAMRIYETVKDNLSAYFQRQEIARLDEDLREHQYDVWGQQKTIRECQLRGIWPRNTQACFGHYGRCEFFDICTTTKLSELKAGILPDGFRRAETMHEELG